MSKQGATLENDMRAEMIASLLTRAGATTKEKREQVEKLLKEGANVNYKFSYVGETLLHIACGLGGGDLAIIKLLIEYGANPNAKDDLGRTPLHQAGMNDHGEVFDYLTNLDPTKKNLVGKNYIKADKTIEYNYAGRLLSPEDSLRNARSHKEEYKDEIKAHQEHKELIIKRRIREAIEQRDIEGFIASLNDLNAANLQSTLDAIDYMDPSVSSPLLHAAAASGQVEMVKELIRRGADVNYGDLEFTYPLHHAIKAKQIEVIKVLLEAGADPLKQPGKKGLPSPLELAEKFIKDEEIVRLLKTIKKEEKIQTRDGDAKKSEVEGPDEDMLSDRKKAVEMAIKKDNLQGFIDALNSLSEICTVDNTVLEPLLHYAAGNGQIVMVKELIRRGADVNYAREDFTLPLHHAIKDKHVEVIKVLLEAGADPLKLPLKKGAKTPLEYAEKIIKDESMVNLLKGTMPVIESQNESLEEVKQDQQETSAVSLTDIKLELTEVKKVTTTADKLRILDALEAEFKKLNNASAEKQKMKELKNIVAHFSASTDEAVKNRACAFADQNGIPRRQDTVVRQLISRFRDPTTLISTLSPTYSVEEMRKLVAGAFFDEKPGYQAGVIKDIKDAYNPDMPVAQKLAFIKNALLVLQTIIELDASGTMFPLLTGDGALQQEYQSLLTTFKEDAHQSKKASLKEEGVPKLSSLENMVNSFESAIKFAIDNNQKDLERLHKNRDGLYAQKNVSTDVESYINIDLQKNESRAKMDNMAKSMADDLYKLACVRIMSVDASDFMGKKWEKEKVTTISDIPDEYNKFAGKITNEILNAKTKEHQINIALFYAKVFQYALASNNYHFANVIGAGLNHGSINKISYLTELPEIKKVYEEQSGKQGVLNAAGKYDVLRKRMEEDAKAGKVPIPIIAYYMGEIVSIAESTPTKMDDPVNASTQTRNPIRIEKMGKTINDFTQYQTLIRKHAKQQPETFSTNIFQSIKNIKPFQNEKDAVATMQAFSWCPRPLTLDKTTTLSELNTLCATMLSNYAQTEIAPALMIIKMDKVELSQEKAYLVMLNIINHGLANADIKKQYDTSKLIGLISEAVIDNNLYQGKLKKEIDKARSLLAKNEAELKQIRDIDNAINSYKNLKIQKNTSPTDESHMKSLSDKISTYNGPMKTELLQNFNRFNQGVKTLNDRLAKLADLKAELETLKNEVPVNFQKLFQLNYDVIENEKLINYGKKEGKIVIDNKSESDYFLGVYARTLEIDKEFTVDLDAVFNEQLKQYLAAIDENMTNEDAQALIALNQKFQVMTNNDFPDVNTSYKKFHNDNISLLFKLVKNLKEKEVISKDEVKEADKSKAPTKPQDAIPIAPIVVPKDALTQEVKVQEPEVKPAPKEAPVVKTADNPSKKANVGELLQNFAGRALEEMFLPRSDAQLEDSIIEAAKIYATLSQANKGQTRSLNELLNLTNKDGKVLHDNAVMLVKALENTVLVTPTSADELKQIMMVLNNIHLDAADKSCEKELDNIKTFLSAKIESLTEKFTFAQAAELHQTYKNLKDSYKIATTQAEKEKAKQDLTTFENKLRNMATTKNKSLRGQVVSFMADQGILGKPEDSLIKQLLSGYKDPTNFKFEVEESISSLKFSPQEVKQFAAALIATQKPEQVLLELQALLQDKRIDAAQRKEIIKNTAELTSAMIQSSIQSEIVADFNTKLSQFMSENADEDITVNEALHQFKVSCDKALHEAKNETQARMLIVAKFGKNEGSPLSIDDVFKTENARVPRKRAEKKGIKDNIDKMAESLADDFYKRGMAYVLNIKPTDLHNLAWAKPKTKDSTNVIGFIEEFNVISNMVQMDILNKPSIREQEEMARFYLKVADYAYQKGDFNTVMAIGAAFNSANLFNLNHLKTLAEREAFFKRPEINNIIDRSKNYAKHREAVLQEQAKGKVIVPYIGLYLTDLTFIEEGMLASRQDPFDGKRPDQVNLDKLEKMAFIYQLIDKRKHDFESKAASMDGMHTDLHAKLEKAKAITDKEVQNAADGFRTSTRYLIDLDTSDAAQMMSQLRTKNPNAKITRIFECTLNGKTLVGEEALSKFLDTLVNMDNSINTLDKEYLQSLSASINAWINDEDNQKLCTPKELEQLKAKSLQLSKKIEFSIHDSAVLPKLLTIREIALTYLSSATNRTRVSVALDKIARDYEAKKSVENQLYYREAQQTQEIIDKFEYIDAAIDRINQDMSTASMVDRLSFAAENKVIIQSLDAPIASLADLAKEVSAFDEIALKHMTQYMLSNKQLLPDIDIALLSDAEIANTYQKLVYKMTASELAKEETTNIEEHSLIQNFMQILNEMQSEDVTLERYLVLEMSAKKIKQGLEVISLESDLEKNTKSRIEVIKNKVGSIESTMKAKLDAKGVKLKEAKRNEFAQQSKEVLAKNKDAIEVSFIDSPLTPVDRKLMEMIDQLEKNLDEYRAVMLKISENPSYYFDTGNRLEELSKEIRHSLELINNLKYGVNLELSNYPELVQAYQEMYKINDREADITLQRIISSTINDTVKQHARELKIALNNKLAQFETLERSRNVVSPRKMAKAAHDLKRDKAQLHSYENKKMIDNLQISEKLPVMPDFNALINAFCQHFEIQATVKKDDNNEDKQVEPKDSLPAFVFKELLDTEKSYITSLFLIDKDLISEMLDKYDSLNADELRGFSTKYQFMDLMAKYNRIRETQILQMNNLQNPDPAAWFADLNRMSELYTEFTQSFNDLKLPSAVEKVINTGEKQSPKLFGSFWIMPIQRFPRYEMLLQSLSKELTSQYAKQYGEPFKNAIKGVDVLDSEPNKQAILSALNLIKEVNIQHAKVKAATEIINIQKKHSEDRPKLLDKLHHCQANPNKHTCKDLIDELNSTSLPPDDVIKILQAVSFEKFKLELAQMLLEHSQNKLAVNNMDNVAAYIQNKVINDKIKAYILNQAEKLSHKKSGDSHYKVILSETLTQIVSKMQNPPFTIDLDNLRQSVINNLPDDNLKQDFDKIVQDEGLFKKLQKIQSKFTLATEEKVSQPYIEPGVSVVPEAPVLSPVNPPVNPQVIPQVVPIHQAPQVDSAILAAQLEEIAELRDNLFSLLYDRADKSDIDNILGQYEALKSEIEKSFPLQSNLFKFRELIAMDISHYNFYIRNNIHSFVSAKNYTSGDVLHAIGRYRTRLQGYAQDNSIAPELRQRFAKDLDSIDQVLKVQIEENREILLTYIDSSQGGALKALVETIAPEVLQKPKVVATQQQDAPLQVPLPLHQDPILPPKPLRAVPQSKTILIQREINVASLAVENKLKRYVVATKSMPENMQPAMTESFLINILNIRNRMVAHKIHKNDRIRSMATVELSKIDNVLNDFIKENPNMPMTAFLRKIVPSEAMLKAPDALVAPDISKLIDIRDTIFELRMLTGTELLSKEDIAQALIELEQDHKKAKQEMEASFPGVKDLMVFRELIAIDKNDQNYKVKLAINGFAEQGTYKNLSALKAIIRQRERLTGISQDSKLSPQIKETALNELNEVDRLLINKLEQSKDLIKAHIKKEKEENVGMLIELIDELAPYLMVEESKKQASTPKVGVILADDKQPQRKVGVVFSDDEKHKWKKGVIPSESESSISEPFISVSNPPNQAPDRRRSLTIEKPKGLKAQEELLTQNSNSLNVLPKFFQETGAQEGVLDKEKMNSYGIHNIVPRKISPTEQELTIQMLVEKEPQNLSQETPTVEINARLAKNGGVVYSLKHSDVSAEQKNKALENFCRAYVLAAEPGTTFTLPTKASPERNELVRSFLLQALKERCEKDGIPHKPELLAVPENAIPVDKEKKKAAPRT